MKKPITIPREKAKKFLQDYHTHYSSLPQVKEVFELLGIPKRTADNWIAEKENSK